jgi:dephospho-CoA kinase
VKSTRGASSTTALSAARPGLAYISGVTLRIFGLTGGIGSGKSAVAKRLLERRLPVVNADELARLAVVAASPGLKQIVDYFGASMLNAAGELDRASLAEVVFSNAESRRILNAIVHPIVRQLAAESFQAIAELGEPLACYEVPLLFEAGLEKTLSPIVVVNAPQSLLRARLAARDGLDGAQVEARIAAQMPLADKARRADFVIDNDGSLADLRDQTDKLLERLCVRLGVSAERYPLPPSDALN